MLIPAGRQLDSFAQLTDDGKTACGCWIYSGCYTERGNMMARRDNTDPGGSGHRAELGLVVAGQSARFSTTALPAIRRAGRGPRRTS